MPSARLDRYFGVALSIRRHDPRPDAELLTRFLDHRDENAFESLVARHAAAVHAACRGWLKSSADIDDAAQATFLVLVRQAGSIRNRAAVGAWLYGVAGKVARRLREQKKRWAPLPSDMPAAAPAGDVELREVLHAEIARLPEKYRLPAQLCYVAGLTTVEAADRLGWPKGTVLTRLAWARKRLQQNLLGRGIAPAVLATLLVGRTPSVHAAWVRTTAQVGLCFLMGEGQEGARISGNVLGLTKGVLRTMVWERARNIGLALLVGLGLLGFGVHRWVLAADQPVRGHASFTQPAAEDDAGRPAPAKSTTVMRRREAIIRLPVGTFVKEVEVQPYGHGRLTWTYEGDRVLGRIEGSVMGVEFELHTEAEYSLSSNGTIYGLLDSVQLTHLKLPEGQQWERLKPFSGCWQAAEPLVNDIMTDMPFSYRFRVQGNRLVISDFRMMLAGPSPLGKLGGIMASGEVGGLIPAYFQALGVAIEGTYTATDAKDIKPTRRSGKESAATSMESFRFRSRK